MEIDSRARLGVTTDMERLRALERERSSRPMRYGTGGNGGFRWRGTSSQADATWHEAMSDS